MNISEHINTHWNLLMATYTKCVCCQAKRAKPPWAILDREAGRALPLFFSNSFCVFFHAVVSPPLRPTYIYIYYIYGTGPAPFSLTTLVTVLFAYHLLLTQLDSSMSLDVFLRFRRDVQSTQTHHLSILVPRFPNLATRSGGDWGRRTCAGRTGQSM